MDFNREYYDENGVRVKTIITGVLMGNLNVSVDVIDRTTPGCLEIARRFTEVQKEIAIVRVSYGGCNINFFVNCTESAVAWHAKGEGDVANQKAYDVRKFLQYDQIAEIETMQQKMVTAAKQHPDEMKKFGIDLSRIATPENA